MESKYKALVGFAPNSFDYTGTEDFALPLGIASIATYLNKVMGKSVEVKVLNGVNLTLKAFIKELKAFQPDLVGLQSTIGNHGNTLYAAEAAKNTGAFVVVGGHNATFLSKELLSNREYVDAVILYEAEVPFQKLAEKLFKNKTLKTVPSLVYREKNSVRYPKQVIIHNLNLLPILDYDLFDLEKHFEASTKAELGRAINYYSGKGCSRRAVSPLIVQSNSSHLLVPFKQFEHSINSMNSCAFCGRMDMGNRRIEEKKLKKLLDNLYSEKRVRFFWDVWDTYCPHEGAKMFNGDETFRFFARISDIDLHYIHSIKKRFGENILLQIGLESGSQRTFDKMNKIRPLTIEEMFKRLTLLRNEGIGIDPSFILGVEGENQTSLEETREFINQAVSLGNVRWLLVSPLTLLPGSPFFRKFISIPEMEKKYAGNDLLNPIEMNEDYLSLFASVTREEVIERLKETRETLPEGVRFGCKGISKKEGTYIGIGNRRVKAIAVNQ